MNKIISVSDLDGFADICSENAFAITAGDSECKGPTDDSTWYEKESDKQITDWMNGNGPNSSK